jgi:hypothetical protein
VNTALHVTNGDVALLALRTAGITGQFIAWRDVLHDGPVPAADWPALREVRARFLASRGWVSHGDALASLTERDEALLAALRARQPVTLWFEHDLYDQLQLIQVLVMAAPFVRDGSPVSMAQAGDYIGGMSASALVALAGAARPVGGAALHAAESAWLAFTAAAPDALRRVAERREDAEDAEDEDVALPYLRPALKRLLEELPNPVTGLSRTELQALRAVAAGRHDLRGAYIAAHHDSESPVWLGDASFAVIVDELCAGPRPLLTRTGDRLAITADGRSVLDEAVHRCTLQRLDRWIGGIHVIH